MRRDTRVICLAVGAPLLVAVSFLSFGVAGDNPAPSGSASRRVAPPKKSEPGRLNFPQAASPLKPAKPGVPAVTPASDSTPQTLDPADLPGGEATAELPAATATPAPPPPTADKPATGKSSGPVTMKYRWETNQIHYFDVTHLMIITSQKDQTSETAVNESRSIKHFRVVSVDADGGAILELVIDRVRMLARFGESDALTFDSDSKDPPPHQFRGVREAIGKPTARVKVSATGRMDQVVRLAAPEPGKSATPDNDPSNSFLMVLPEGPVDVGQGWTDKIEVKVSPSKDLTQNVTILRKYEVESIEGSRVTIKMESTVLTPVKDPMLIGQLIQRTPSGTAVFDLEKGQVVARESKVSKTEINVLGPKSSMRAVGELTERLVSREEAMKRGGEPLRTAAKIEKPSLPDGSTEKK